MTPREYLRMIGRKGAKARMKSTTPESRKLQAEKAARTRWDKAKAKGREGNQNPGHEYKSRYQKSESKGGNHNAN